MKFVNIGEDLRIVRKDEYNWQIQRLQKKQWLPWPHTNYYGTLVGALKSIPATLMQTSDKNSLQAILRGLRGIQETIETAVSHREFLRG